MDKEQKKFRKGDYIYHVNTARITVASLLDSKTLRWVLADHLESILEKVTITQVSRYYIVYFNSYGGTCSDSKVNFFHTKAEALDRVVKGIGEIVQGLHSEIDKLVEKAHLIEEAQLGWIRASNGIKIHNLFHNISISQSK